jgi:hypothetical protein
MRMALAVGRLDFWNLNNGRRDDDLTPYEELLWRAYEVVEPHGERRADLRMAKQTLWLLQAQCQKEISEERQRVIVKNLLDFGENDDDQDLTPDEAAQKGRAAFAAIGK